MKLKHARRLSYDEQKTRLREFILNHDDFDSTYIDDRYGRKKYMIRLVIITLSSKPLLTKRAILLK